MPAFNDHIDQANENLGFLEYLNLNCDGSFLDWKVTVSFYVAVHIINAHLSKHGLQYRSHSLVQEAINPRNQFTIAKVSEPVYLAYRKLQGLSRRSRYLVNEKAPASTTASKIYETHINKSIRHLEVLLKFCDEHLTVSIKGFKIQSASLNKEQFKYLDIQKK